MKTLRLILGDQLNIEHSWFQKPDPNVTFIMMEIRSETDYVLHHIQKVIAIFAAMRRFARELRERGHDVLYLELDDPKNLHSFGQNVRAELGSKTYSCFEYQHPDEYRVAEHLKTLCSQLPLKTQCWDTEHFIASLEDFHEVFPKKDNYLMETFYRAMRKKSGYLMEGGKPAGGQWNFDSENRKKLPKSEKLPELYVFHHDVSELQSLIERAGVRTFGAVDASAFPWPESRAESLLILEHFCKELLPNFGMYQDAMTTRDPYLFHSRLSFALNVKMISPRTVIERAIQAWREAPKRISLAQIEGFVRQILGWREYVRCIYWANMPTYAQENYFHHQRKLPEYFWSGKTKMECLRHSLTQSLELAYAHHIQRLMVIGNFALLAELSPDEVDAWYLGVYIDAFEWVELPNTRGMSQFADGGLLATKPYISSANYINKMSDYCSQCSYDRERRSGAGSCPFNSLYWSFLKSKEEKLRPLRRMSMMYKLMDSISESELEEIQGTAERYRANLDTI